MLTSLLVDKSNCGRLQLPLFPIFKRISGALLNYETVGSNLDERSDPSEGGKWKHCNAAHAEI